MSEGQEAGLGDLDPSPARLDFRRFVPASLGKAGPWTRVLVVAAFSLTAIYLIDASIQGFLKVGSVIGWVWLPVGLFLIAFVALLSRVPIPNWAIGLGAVLIAATWGLIVQGEPASDYANFYSHASSFAESPSFASLHASKSPTAVLVYGSWMAVFGVSVTAAQLIGAIAHGVTAVCIALIANNLGYPLRVGRLAALLFALSPGVVTYSSAISSEAVLLLTLMPGLTLYVMALTSEHSQIWSFGMAGVLLGLSYLATPVGGFFAIGAAAFLLFVVIDSHDRRAVGALALLVGAIALAPAFQTGLNVAFDGRWSPTTSSNAAMGILHGTSVQCNGRWCPVDMELAGFIGPEKVDYDEASRRAMEIAGERWRADPVGLILFSTTTKVREMWREESHMLGWAMMGSPRIEEWEASGTTNALERGVDSYHLGALAVLPIAVIVVWRRRRLAPLVVAISLGLLGTAAIHILMVAQQRYHLVFLPFVFGLIAVALFGGGDNTAGEREEVSGGPASRSMVGTRP